MGEGRHPDGAGKGPSWHSQSLPQCSSFAQPGTLTYNPGQMPQCMGEMHEQAKVTLSEEP